MATETEIANRAMQKLGAKRILAFGDTSTKEGREISAAWDQVRRGELRRANWNFAITRASLAAIVATPVYGFSYAHALPDLCLRIIDVSSDNTTSSVLSVGDYARESLADGTQVVASDNTPLWVRYVRDVTNVAIWDVMFCEVMATQLALQLCQQITDSNSRKEALEAEYRWQSRDARNADAIENPPDQLPDDEWNEARL